MPNPSFSGLYSFARVAPQADFCNDAMKGNLKQRMSKKPNEGLKMPKMSIYNPN